MATRTLVAIVLFLGLVAFSSAWFVSGDDRNCFCKAVKNYGHAVVKDFGSVQKCHGWPTCACRRTEMRDCNLKCERKVKQWVCQDNCEGKAQGVKIRTHYKASTCGTGYTNVVFKCGSQTNCGQK